MHESQKREPTAPIFINEAVVSMGVVQPRVPRPPHKRSHTLSYRKTMSHHIIKVSSLQEKLRSPMSSWRSVRTGEPDSRSTTPSSPQHMIINAPLMSSKVALAAGRFWGTEKFVVEGFQERYPGSIKSTTVGFMSPYDDGVAKTVTYEHVCAGRSGHIEVLLVELHDSEAHFEELLRYFFQFHDPTTKFQQGSDRGFQFSSWIFCSDEQQALIAKRVRLELQHLIDTGVVATYEKNKVATCISSMQTFTAAPDEHQQYWRKQPQAKFGQRLFFGEWPEGEDHPLSTTAGPSSIPSLSSLSTSFSSSSSSSSASSLSLAEEDRRKRLSALKKLRQSQRRQEVMHSIVCTLHSS